MVYQKGAFSSFFIYGFIFFVFYIFPIQIRIPSGITVVVR